MIAANEWLNLLGLLHSHKFGSRAADFDGGFLAEVGLKPNLFCKLNLGKITKRVEVFMG